MSIEIYNRNSAVTDDPYRLILKLYEGLLQFLSFTKDAMEKGDIETKFKYVNKSITIFDELRNILDYDGGEIAHYLDGLYLYQIETLFSAGLNDNINSVEQVMQVVRGLIEAWKEETGL